MLWNYRRPGSGTGDSYKGRTDIPAKHLVVKLKYCMQVDVLCFYWVTTEDKTADLSLVKLRGLYFINFVLTLEKSPFICKTKQIWTYPQCGQNVSANCFLLIIILLNYHIINMIHIHTTRKLIKHTIYVLQKQIIMYCDCNETLLNITLCLFCIISFRSIFIDFVWCSNAFLSYVKHFNLPF